MFYFKAHLGYTKLSVSQDTMARVTAKFMGRDTIFRFIASTVRSSDTLYILNVSVVEYTLLVIPVLLLCSRQCPVTFPPFRFCRNVFYYSQNTRKQNETAVFNMSRNCDVARKQRYVNIMIIKVPQSSSFRTFAFVYHASFSIP